MKWFRLYNDLRHDPKVQNLRPELFRFWINLLCMASDQEERGTIPSINAIAVDLGMRRDHVEGFMAALEASYLLLRSSLEGPKEEIRSYKGTFKIHAWSSRQPQSDNVAIRVKSHRERVSDESNRQTKPDMKRYIENERNVTCNVLDSDTDTENTPNSRARTHEGPPSTDPLSDPAYHVALSAVQESLGSVAAGKLDYERDTVGSQIKGRWDCLAAAAAETRRRMDQKNGKPIHSPYGFMLSKAMEYSLKSGPPPVSIPFARKPEPKPLYYQPLECDEATRAKYENPKKPGSTTLPSMNGAGGLGSHGPR
jgi:hypothetical protein